MKKFRLKTVKGEVVLSAVNMTAAIAAVGDSVVSAEEIKKPTILYVAGPMTGVKDFNRDKFNMAAAELRRQGYEVRNPACLDQDWSNYEHYIEVGLMMLRQCDGYVLLPDWGLSKGTAGEMAEAERYGVPRCEGLLRSVWGQLWPEWADK